MKLTENYIRQNSIPKLWDWGQYKDELKYEYKNDILVRLRLIK